VLFCSRCLINESYFVASTILLIKILSKVEVILKVFISMQIMEIEMEVANEGNNNNDIFSVLKDSPSLDIVDQLYLEDFASTGKFDSKLIPRRNIKTLRLSITFENTDVSAKGQLEQLYVQSINNLKQLTPNLQSISFDGGYIYRPDEETVQAVLSELKLLRSHLEMLSSLFISQGLPVLRLHFSAIFAFDEKTIYEANVPDMLKNVFDFCDDIDGKFVQRGILNFIYITTNGLPFTIRLLLNVPILKNFVPFTRTRFCDGSSESLSRFFKF